MPQQGWFWPLSVVVVGLVVVGWMLAEPAASPRAAPASEIAPVTTTPLFLAQTQTATPTYPPPTKTRTPRPTSTYPAPTSTRTPTPSATRTTPATTQDDTTTPATETPEPTETPDPDQDTPTAGPTPTSTPTASPTDAPTPSPTGAPTRRPAAEAAQEIDLTATEVVSGSDVLVCLPGVPAEIRGRDAPPAESLLLSFGTRVVGGGISDMQGNYVLHLTVGQEKSGIYPVEIRVRGSGVVVSRRSCHVPRPTLTPTLAPTPTPTLTPTLSVP